MIRLDGVELRRGGARVLGDASLAIRRRWKVGVVGANGAGKSSLLALLLCSASWSPIGAKSSYPPASWWRRWPRKRRAAMSPSSTTWSPAIRASRRSAPGSRMPGRAETPRQRRRAHADLEAVHGYAAEAAASRVLRGLGFAPDDGPAASGHPLRGLEDARRARPHPRHPLGPPPARRAHEPPRPRCGGLAGRLVAALHRDPAAHLPRPGVPRSRRGPRRLGHRWPDLLLHRELQRVRTAARRRDSRTRAGPRTANGASVRGSRRSSTVSATRRARRGRPRADSRRWSGCRR